VSNIDQRAIGSTDQKSKEDWAAWPIERHTMAYLAVRTNGEIAQIEISAK